MRSDENEVSPHPLCAVHDRLVLRVHEQLDAGRLRIGRPTLERLLQFPLGALNKSVERGSVLRKPRGLELHSVRDVQAGVGSSGQSVCRAQHEPRW